MAGWGVGYSLTCTPAALYAHTPPLYMLTPPVCLYTPAALWPVCYPSMAAHALASDAV